MPGDYKARLVQDVHKTGYESSQAYEFLFPDKNNEKIRSGRAGRVTITIQKWRNT
jgi:hypothetical protein